MILLIDTCILIWILASLPPPETMKLSVSISPPISAELAATGFVNVIFTVVRLPTEEPYTGTAFSVCHNISLPYL